MSKCKHAKNSSVEGYYICDLDNSRRKISCHCPKYTPTLWYRIKTKIKTWFSTHFL